MGVQSDINSALGQLGIMASLNPELQEAAKERGELRKLNRESEMLGNRQVTVLNEFDKLVGEIGADKARVEELESRGKKGGLTKEEEQELESVQELQKMQQKKFNVLKAEQKGLDQRQGEILTQQYHMSPEAYADSYFAYKYGSPPKEYDIKKARQARERASNMSRAKQELRGFRDEVLSRGGELYPDRREPFASAALNFRGVDDFKPDTNRYGADRIAAEFKRRNNEQK